MIISPYCEKLDMAIRLLTIVHCRRRLGDNCERGECEHFGMRLYSKDGF